MERSSSSHNELIIDQFTKQAVPFANLPAHSDEDASKLLFTLSEASKDGFCGPKYGITNLRTDFGS
jgi:hypothetical protein